MTQHAIAQKRFTQHLFQSVCHLDEGHKSITPKDR